MVEESKDYADKVVAPFIQELTQALIQKKPDDIVYIK